MILMIIIIIIIMIIIEIIIIIHGKSREGGPQALQRAYRPVRNSW